MPMPTVLRCNGVEIMIYVHDHKPKHVHCFVSGNEIIINLETLEVRESHASHRDARKAWKLVEANKDFLIAEWERIGPIP